MLAMKSGCGTGHRRLWQNASINCIGFHFHSLLLTNITMVRQLWHGVGISLRKSITAQTCRTDSNVNCYTSYLPLVPLTQGTSQTRIGQYGHRLSHLFFVLKKPPPLLESVAGRKYHCRLRRSSRLHHHNASQVRMIIARPRWSRGAYRTNRLPAF